MTMAALIVFAVVGVITWLAVNAEQPSQRLRYRRILRSVAITSTIVFTVMLALSYYLMRTAPDSPAGAVPFVLAIPCAFIAVPSWIGFVVQARLAKRL
jgi:cytochrome bd-type quinol oxidase subunit 2